MESKSNKELALEAAIEYMKSWNAAPRNSSIKPDEFIELIKSLYNEICSLDKN